MNDPNPGSPSLEDLLYMLNHVFLPPKLPPSDDNHDLEVDHDVTLCRFAHKISCEFARFLSESQQKNWSVVTQMLKTLKTSRAMDKDVLLNNILRLGEGGRYHSGVHVPLSSLIISNSCRSSGNPCPCSKCCPYSAQVPRYYGF